MSFNHVIIGLFKWADITYLSHKSPIPKQYFCFMMRLEHNKLNPIREIGGEDMPYMSDYDDWYDTYDGQRN